MSVYGFGIVHSYLYYSSKNIDSCEWSHSLFGGCLYIFVIFAAKHYDDYFMYSFRLCSYVVRERLFHFFFCEHNLINSLNSTLIIEEIEDCFCIVLPIMVCFWDTLFRVFLLVNLSKDKLIRDSTEWSLYLCMFYTRMFANNKGLLLTFAEKISCCLWIWNVYVFAFRLE